jgi:ornithine decarboxylase
MRIYTTAPGLRIISKIPQHLNAPQDRFSCINTNSRWIYDKSNVYKQIDNWAQNIPWIKPFYAVKANPSQHLIEDILSHPFKLGLDVASLAEIELALKNTSPCNTIYTNPHTINHELDKYKTKPINIKVVDSIGELKKMLHMKHMPQILIRINGGNTRGDTNFDTKFGATKEETDQLLEYAKQNDIPIRGISFHIGSGGTYNRKEAYMNAYANAIPYLEYIASHQTNAQTHAQTPRPILNFGGGLLHNTNLKEVLGWTKTLPYQMIAEPGRYIAEPSHHLFSQVIAVTRRGVYLDNGIYHELNCYQRDHWKFPDITHYVSQCPPATTSTIMTMSNIATTILTTTTKTIPRPTIVKSKRATRVFGPTCDSGDVIHECSLPVDIQEGDWFLLPNMGAYTNAGMIEFNGIEGASSYAPIHLSTTTGPDPFPYSRNRSRPLAHVQVQVPAHTPKLATDPNQLTI